MINCFSSEEDLTLATLQSTDFQEGFYDSDWIRWGAREVGGLFGVPDVVIAFGKITSDGRRIIRTLAFEMKIKHWRRALAQAFRYSAFAHYSYVVLDEAFAHSAIPNIEFFRKANIGLLSIDVYSNITWHHRPRYQKPYSQQLYQAFYTDLNAHLFHPVIQH